MNGGQKGHEKNGIRTHLHIMCPEKFDGLSKFRILYPKKRQNLYPGSTFFVFN